MAYNNLFSTQHLHSRKTLGNLKGYSIARLHRNSVAGQSRFKTILSAIQNRSTVKRFKIRGLTIADYRAQPVISKSGFRPLPSLIIKPINNKVLSRIQAPSSSAMLSSSSRSRVEPGLKILDSAKEPEKKVQQSSPVLTERQIIEASIQKAAAKYDLPPALIRAVIRAESNFEVGAVSRAGAKGLMQLMPATAKELGVTDIFDIKQNIDGGAKYLRQMLDRFGGNVRKALAAYNAGPGTVIKYNGRVPYPETQQYVKRVLRFSEQTA